MSICLFCTILNSDFISRVCLLELPTLFCIGMHLANAAGIASAVSQKSNSEVISQQQVNGSRLCREDESSMLRQTAFFVTCLMLTVNKPSALPRKLPD